jgi:CheY-like chemotaxis protein
VVEDEVVIRRLLVELLSSRFGCRVEVAANGKEALDALDQGSYALVITDIRMPVMSGTELYLRLRESRPELARRFVFITGHAGDKQLEGEIAKWNVPVVAKPFTLERLAEVCGPILKDRERGAKRPLSPG